ncbi:MAG: amicyanin [Chloroflexi bacterium]|nr:amicyanin [Chloroflexota bacterium]MDA1004646.1 amicyanin [Chloroflexota bacterium]
MRERTKVRGWGRVLGALLLAVVAAAALGGCLGASLDDDTPAAGVTTVAVRDNRFDPRVIQVPAGTDVTWDWSGAKRAHNVVGDGFASEVQGSGSFLHRFDVAGSFDYLCTLHGGMRGRVIVTP